MNKTMAEHSFSIPCMLVFFAVSLCSAATSTVFEAEVFSSQSGCTVDSTQWPYFGTGYVAFGAPGSWVEWNNIEADAAGNFRIIFKHFNKTSVNSTFKLNVNGTYLRDCTFKPTSFEGSNTHWKVFSAVIALNAGSNTVRLTSATTNSGQLVDNIAITGGALAGPVAPVFDVAEFGAVGNGSTVNTAAIQKAIDACAGTGGSVYLKQGTFLTGTLRLKSKMTLYIDEKATIMGTKNKSDYPDCIPSNCNNWMSTVGECGKALVYSAGQSDIAITGGGTINGNSAMSVFTGGERTRPIALYLTTGSNISVTGVDVFNSNCWTFVPLEVTNLYMDAVNVQSTEHLNRDGMDPCDCRHVVITNSTIAGADDGFCIKSGSLTGNDDFLIANCTILSISNPIKFGTTSYGGFTNITFRDICIPKTHYSKAGISLGIADGAKVDNIKFINIRMGGQMCPLYVLNGGGVRDRRPPGAPSHKGPASGPVSNIVFRDIDARHAIDNVGCFFTGTISDNVTYPIKNLTFDNVKVNNMGDVHNQPAHPREYLKSDYPDFFWFGSGELPAYGFYIRHVDGLAMSDVAGTLSKTDARPQVVKVDVTAVHTVPFLCSPKKPFRHGVSFRRGCLYFTEALPNDCAVTVTAVNGRVLSRRPVSGSSEKSITIGGLCNGVYVVTVTGPGTTIVRKLPVR